MSLRWEFTDKEAFAKLTEEDRKLNDYFVWASLFLDMTSITEKNAPEWVWRWAFGSRLNGPYYTREVDGKQVPYVPTVEEVKKRVGLRTNVTQRTRKQFIDKAVRIYGGTNPEA